MVVPCADRRGNWVMAGVGLVMVSINDYFTDG